jgi:hypothetical protein
LGDLFNQLIMQAAGHLTKVKYFAPAQPDLKGVETRQGDYAVNQLADRMNRADLVGDVVTQWHRLAERRRTIAFAVDVGHSVSIHDEFVKAGVRAEHLDGSTDKDERKAILARLESGETEVVVNCMVLTEGFDCPPVGCIVLARPTKQISLYRQMAGRGLRPADGKSDLILIDHSGAVYRHGLLEDEIFWTLDVDIKAVNIDQAARSTKDRDPFCECTQCGHVRIRGEACGNCDFKPGVRPDLIIAKDEDLVELGRRAAGYSYEDRQRWHGMLIQIAIDRQYKQGWVGHKYKEKFGTWPPTRVVPSAMKPSPEVLPWVRSRQIAFAKARQKASAA